MTRLGLLVRSFAALAALTALSGAPARAQVPATGIFVESENFAFSAGNATLASGPNIGGIGNAGAIVSVDAAAGFSGGKHIGFFDYYDWLEYDVTIPEDGLYSVQYRYASDWPANDTFPQDLVFYSSGQRITPPGAPNTANWGDYQMYTLPDSIALKQGVNRFRVRIRPDFGLVATLGGSMNMDYIKFVKTGDYPNLVAVSGTVTAMVNGSATPLQGAMVYENPAGDLAFADATHITRTDANGHYTLFLSPGNHLISAFYNGYATSDAAVTAPETKDFSLTFNGRFEAELLDATNPGRSSTDGVLAAYATGIYDAGSARIGSYSANGLVTIAGSKFAGKFAAYNHVVVPAAGAYDLTIHYSSDQTSDIGLPYAWTVGSGGGPQTTLAGSGDFNTFQDSAPVLVNLKAGVNSLRWTAQDPTHYARVDYFTVTPTSRPHGALNVVVTDTAGKPVPGAKISVTGDNANYADQADGTGKLSIPLPVGTYTVTASKSGSSANVGVTVTDGGTATANLTLALTAIVVEGESYAASGPEPAGSGVKVQDLENASGGKVLTDLRGRGNPDAGSNYRYAEWTVNVPQAGWYKFGMSYATSYGHSQDDTITSPSFSLHVDTTSARFDYPIPDSGSSSVYVDFTTASGQPIELPLVQGDNKIRLTMGDGGINVDYLTLDRDTAKPVTTFKTITGTVSGTDGVGTAPIRGAALFSSWFGNSPVGAAYTAVTDASGHYTLHVPTAGVNGDGSSPVAALAPGYETSGSTNATSTADFALTLNTPRTLDMDFTDVATIIAQVLDMGTGRITTTVGQLAYVSPGPDTWIDLNVNAPRSGMYDLSMNYSSNWLAPDASAILPVSVGGATFTGTFPMTGDWSNFQTLSPLVTIPLQAGPNAVRLSFPEAAANVMYLDFQRSGDLPPMASTDIDGNGVTDLRDAVIYARRLAGAEAGTTPDLNGDTASNAADVQRILSVAGGLM